jgi:hypothetical protein
MKCIINPIETGQIKSPSKDRYTNLGKKKLRNTNNIIGEKHNNIIHL